MQNCGNIKELKIEGCVFLKIRCKKCQGKLYIEHDSSYGDYIKCLCCGYEEPIQTIPQEHKDWSLPENKK
jgi:uncharacterized Zn finger protein (UPF0148 family)